MAHFNLIPLWFIVYGIIFELVFVFSTLLVAYFSFRIYKIYPNQKIKYFGITFLFFSFSYLIQSILDILFVLNLDYSFSIIGMYIHTSFFSLGLLLLVFKVFHRKIPFYIAPIVLIFLIPLYLYSFYFFYLFSSALFFYAAVFYFNNFTRNKKPSTIFVFMAFLFLFISHFHFLVSVNHQFFSVLGFFLEFIAYLFLIINLLIIKNGSKKK